MGSIFFEITIILTIATLLAILFRIFKQPSILAYILTGILIGPFAVIHIQNREVIQNFSEFGITLLLFLLGLELRLGEFASVGKIAALIATAQVVLTGLLSFFLATLLQFPFQSSLYISIALTFSSTVIVVKLLADKKELKTLYGKLSIGILLAQDVFAILFLILLSGYHPVASPIFLIEYILVLGLKTAIVLCVVIILSRYILPRILHNIAKSQETLFLFSLAWVFGMSAVVSSPIIGFSIEIGGLLAGLSLANSSENFQIVAKVRPLRDFFMTIFFVFLGMEMGVGSIGAILFPAILLSIFVLLVKPLILMTILGALAYKKKTSFLTSINFAQISEFSLIIVVLGNRLGHVPNNIISLITLVAIISFALSTYVTTHSSAVYAFFANYLSVFEWRKGSQEKFGIQESYTNHILFIGGTKMGKTILDSLRGTGQHVVVVDFDPDVVKKLERENVPVVFGDIVDPDIAEKANIAKARLIISTIADVQDSLMLIKTVHHENKKAKIIVMAYDIDDANVFYEEGADYVVLPHLAGGRQIARTINSDDFGKFEDLKEKDMEYLQ